MLSLRNKTNPELFELYRAELALRYRSQRALKEAYRELGHFEQHLGGYPPSAELAKGFLSQFLSRKTNTLARYTQIIGGFLKWYGDPLDFKVRQPEQLPQVVENSDIDRIIETMRSRRSHKKKTQRDILLIETGLGTGLRAGELAALRVGDIDFRNMLLVVRRGKGEKDRAIPLLPSLSAKLETFCGGKGREDTVFALARATISNKVGEWARKAGVPHVHAHSLRHSFGSALARRGVGARTIQQLLGHSNLATSQRYIDLVGRDLREAVNLLDTPQQPPVSPQVATPPDPYRKPMSWQRPEYQAPSEGDTKLPPHVWRLRRDYEAIKELADGMKTAQESPKEAQIGEAPYKGKDHKKIQELAGTLQREITLPAILNTFIPELKPGPIVYADYRGHTHHSCIVRAENGEISVELSVGGKEETDPIWQGLRSHLKTGGFSDVLGEIDTWKELVGQIFKKRHGLLKLATGEIKEQVKIPDEAVERNERRGYRKAFFTSACADSVEIAKGNPPVTDSGYWCEPVTNEKSWVLIRYGHGEIYVAKTELGTKRYRSRHGRLSLRLSGTKLAKDTAQLYKNLEEAGETIRNRLQKFRDMQRVPGHCELCCC